MINKSSKKVTDNRSYDHLLSDLLLVACAKKGVI